MPPAAPLEPRPCSLAGFRSLLCFPGALGCGSALASCGFCLHQRVGLEVRGLRHSPWSRQRGAARELNTPRHHGPRGSVHTNIGPCRAGTRTGTAGPRVVPRELSPDQTPLTDALGQEGPRRDTSPRSTQREDTQS